MFHVEKDVNQLSFAVYIGFLANFTFCERFQSFSHKKEARLRGKPRYTKTQLKNKCAKWFHDMQIAFTFLNAVVQRSI